MWCDVSCEKRKEWSTLLRRTRGERKGKRNQVGKTRDVTNAAVTPDIWPSVCVRVEPILATTQLGAWGVGREGGGTGRFVFLPLGPFLASSLRKKSRSLHGAAGKLVKQTRKTAERTF